MVVEYGVYCTLSRVHTQYVVYSTRESEMFIFRKAAVSCLTGVKVYLSFCIVRAKMHTRDGRKIQ